MRPSPPGVIMTEGGRRTEETGGLLNAPDQGTSVVRGSAFRRRLYSYLYNSTKTSI